MRGKYTLCSRTERSAAEEVQALGLEDGFFADREALEKALVFAADADGETVEVYAEMGENLLLWARQEGRITIRKMP